MSTRRWLSALLVAALSLGLAACANDPLSSQYRSGDNKGFIAGEFQVQEYPVSERKGAVDFSGTTDAGTQLSSQSLRGKPVVVNFWYSTCGPCRAEAPILEKAYQQLEGDGVHFVGVNIYDQAATSAAFGRTYGLSYPSLLAADDGAIKMAFAQYVPLSAVPVTIVLDAQGRVSARIISQLTDPSILVSLVRTAEGITPTPGATP